MSRILLFLWLLALPGLHCTRYLEERPDKGLAVPATLRDLQALLDNNFPINAAAPGTGEASADNYYLTESDWATVSYESYPRMYTWAHDDLYEFFPNDYAFTYQVVYLANTVLEALAGVPRTERNAAEWDNIKGQALFLRAQAFLQGAFLWCKAYDGATAAADLGLPLRLQADFTAPSVRASVKETYERILLDAVESIRLLPPLAIAPTRGSRAAAYALAARTCLSMRAYEQAGRYADSSLQLYGTLLDFGTLDPSAAYPVPPLNEEVLFHSEIATPVILQDTRARIDTALYDAYGPGDLRRVIFFRTSADGSHYFKGSYLGQPNLFGGITTSEVYLMRAESAARSGRVADALRDLNTLLASRWQQGAFTPVAAADAAEALRIILEERRKELLMRGLRWMDLKRLNKEPAFARTLVHRYRGQTYTLPPDDPRYALPLPREVIERTGMPQNPR